MPIRNNCGMQCLEIFTDCLGNVSFHINEDNSKLGSSFKPPYLVLWQRCCCSPPFLTCGPIRLHYPFSSNPSIKASLFTLHTLQEKEVKMRDGRRTEVDAGGKRRTSFNCNAGKYSASSGVRFMDSH